MDLPQWAKGRDESEVRLEVEDYIQAVAETLEGQDWLRRLRKRIDEREREIGNALWQAAVGRYWKEEASRWAVGQRVWCNASGVFLGGTVQRGTERVVAYIQKRARRVWLAAPGQEKDRRRWVWYNAAGLLRYNFRPQPPDNPVDPQEAANLERLGRTITETLHEVL